MPDNYSYIFSDMSAADIEADLHSKIYSALHSLYSTSPDPTVAKRVREEWHAMERTNTVLDVAALYELSLWLKKSGKPYWLRAHAGSSFILYLLGITSGNPLPPHFRCPECHSILWMPFYPDGFDLPEEAYCAKDNASLTADGHDVPWQTLWGYGEHQPVFDVDLPKSLYDKFAVLLESHWLGRLKADAVPFSPYERGIKCVKFSSLSLMFVLDEKEISPEFHSRHFTASDMPLIISNWEPLVQYTESAESEFPEPDSFSDILALSGLLHSTGAWDDDCGFMLERLGYSLSDMIAFRDDVYSYLLAHGFPEKDAWRGMNRARKGLELPLVTDEMLAARDKWVLNRLERIRYLFPKAHAVEYIFFKLKSLM